MKKTFGAGSRFYLIIVGGALSFVLCYLVAVRKTIREYKLFTENKVKLELITDAPEQLKLLKNKIEEYNEFFNSSSINNNDYQVHLLNVTNQLFKGRSIKITEIPKLTSELKDNFVIETQAIVFQGQFFDLLRLIQDFGNYETLGNICSVDFYNQKDIKTGTNYLKMKVFFQNINEAKVL
ncbi:MAG TPA: hypothetical protein VHO50_12100 [Bacteroidales bacterium]|nr:hypothetical protein [Bacteroidales bacterium]